jgi:hypothetical protein
LIKMGYNARETSLASTMAEVAILSIQRASKKIRPSSPDARGLRVSDW